MNPSVRDISMVSPEVLLQHQTGDSDYAQPSIVIKAPQTQQDQQGPDLWAAHSHSRASYNPQIAPQYYPSVLLATK